MLNTPDTLIKVFVVIVVVVVDILSVMDHINAQTRHAHLEWNMEL